MINIPDIILIPLLFVIGASFGSFLNVVIYRVPKKMSIIRPASHCFSCIQTYMMIGDFPYILMTRLSVCHRDQL